MNKLTRKDRIINALIVVSVLVVGFVVWYLPPAIAYWRSSEVYKRYSRAEGVRATYVKDFRVNDTLTVGVTLLEATDSAGWERMIKKFNIPQELIEENEIDIWTRKSLKNHPETAYKKSDADQQEVETKPVIEIVAISMKKHQICLFHTQNEKEQDAVFCDRLNSNINH